MAPRIEYIVILAVLLLAQAASAFAPSDYLYPNETASSINSSGFMLNSAPYTMVKISGKDAFLLMDDELMQNASEIRAVLFQYYTATLYPTDSELSSIHSMLLAFNESRNAKTKYGYAEDVCVRSTGLTIRDCTDYFTCLQLGSLVCALQGSTGCDPELLATYTLEYNTNRKQLTSQYSEVEANFNAITQNNIDSKLAAIIARVPDLKNSSQKITKSKLMFPENFEDCPECIGICPLPPFNYTALDSAKSRMEALRTRLNPLTNVDSGSAAIAANTKARLDYKVNLHLGGYYSKELAAFRKANNATITDAVKAASMFTGSSFNTDVDAMLAKEQELNQRIADNNFTGMNESYDQYEAIVKRISIALPNITKVYKSAVDQKENASDLLIRAEWRVDKSDEDMVLKLSSLKQKQAQLDAKYVPPMPLASYGDMYDDYSSLTNYSSRLLSDASAARTNSLYILAAALAKNGVDSAIDLASMVTPITYQTRRNYASYVPTAMLAIIDFSLVCLSLVLFIWVVVTFRSVFRTRAVLFAWGAALIVFIALLAIGSAGFYYLVSKASETASFSDFMYAVNEQNDMAIMVYATTAPKSALPNMRACAQNVSAVANRLDKSATVYEMAGQNCTIGNKTMSADDCWAMIRDVPLVQLKYSQASKTPQFYTVFEKTAVVTGDAEYMARCDIADVME